MKPPSARNLLNTYVPPLLMLACIAAVSRIYHVSVSTMTADPAAVARFHPLTGVLSNLGVLVWCAAASICAFAAAALPRDERTSRHFLLTTAALSSYLMSDDLFLLHENLMPYLGMKETAIYALLAIAVCAYFLAFWRVILRTDVFFLLAAGAFLAGSAGIDAVLEAWLLRHIGHWEYFIEDGAKWLGIASWCRYCASASLHLLDGAREREKKRLGKAAPSAYPGSAELALLRPTRRS